MELSLKWDRYRSTRRRAGCVVAELGALLLLAGCQTVPRLAPVSFEQPGWVVRQGQAVWKAKRGAPEIAGEILVATRNDGRAFVQFTKTPFPFVIAQSTTNSWQIESPTQNKLYSGLGQPPVRIIWFHLPRLLSGARASKGWIWHDGTEWKLENSKSGESLEGYFSL